VSGPGQQFSGQTLLLPWVLSQTHNEQKSVQPHVNLFLVLLHVTTYFFAAKKTFALWWGFKKIGA
jgi:hypothetical protein